MRPVATSEPEHWTTASGHPMSGSADPAFEELRMQFERNFDEQGDTGAALAVYVDGVLVVDLWGGYRSKHTRTAWTQDTRVLVFSCSKGVLSLCAAMLVQEGRLDLDVPAAEYWPEFAANGKARISVRMLLNHQSGLPYLVPALNRRELLDWGRPVKVLEQQRPLWAPGTWELYHGHTIGWLVGEVIRRVSGLTPREFLRDRIAAPLGVSSSFGVERSALTGLAVLESPLKSLDEEAQRAYEAMCDQDPWWLRMLSLDEAIPFPSFGQPVAYNGDDILTAELPATNLVTSARDLARIYSAAVAETDGLRLVGGDVLRDMARYQTGGGRYETPMDPAMRWGSGFMIDSAYRPMLGHGSFGHDGAGGSLAFGHLGHRVGFAYTTNQMGGIPDTRSNDLCSALMKAL